MGVIQDLVDAGYVGYRGWTDEAAALADFKATGGAGKIGGSSGGGGGGGSYQPISAADFSKLEEKAFELSKPYYIQIVKESRGDLTRARQILEEDYVKNTREARERNALDVEAEKKSLEGSLGTLGLTFVTEQEKKLGDLNKRGMAVEQMGPEGQYNALGLSSISPEVGTDVSTIVGAGTGVTGGRGSVELNRLKLEQKLRQEAVQRVANKKIAELGLELKGYTNPPTGDLTAPGVDRTKLGSAELAKLRGTEQYTRQQQLTEQELFEKRRQEAFQTASQVAGLQAKEIPTSLANRYLQNAQTDFTNLGYTG